MAGRTTDRIRIASFPHWYAPNQYLPLFYAALESYGIEHVPNLPLRIADLTSAGVNVVHVHWPYAIWRDRHRSLPGQLRRIVGLRGFLRQAKQHGLPVLWTVHNVEPASWIDALGNRLIYQAADLCIFHSASAQAAADSHYGKRNGASLVMSHGNYDGVLATPRARAQTLRTLGIAEERTVLLCFGQIREYKGFELALHALMQLPPAQFQLVIAGRPIDASADRLKAEASSNVSLLLEELDDQTLANLLEAADLVLLPYRSTTGSGVLLHALTASRAVVASDLPYFRDVLTGHNDCGVLVQPGNAAELAAGITQLMRVDAAARARAARALAAEFAWPRIVQPVAEWLHAHDRG